MGAVKHVPSDETPDENKTVSFENKPGKPILNNFSKLIHPQANVRIKSGSNLLRHLCENDNENELKYALGRIVRGLGSSTLNARAGFYTALVGLMQSCEADNINVNTILQLVEKELKKGGSNSKSENADICAGQILACGALIRTGKFLDSSEDDQKKIMEVLLNASKERTYLTLMGYTFIVNLLENDDFKEKSFKNIVFPLLKPELAKNWQEQSLDSLYLLIKCQNRFPQIINRKFLSNALNSDKIICSDNFDCLSHVLMTIPSISVVNHPIYGLIIDKLLEDTQLLKIFQYLDKNLSKPNRNKQLVFLNILSKVLNKKSEIGGNFKELPLILTDNFIQQMLNYYKTINGRQKDEDFQNAMRNCFTALVNVVKSSEIESNVKVDLLKRLQFHPGSFQFEKFTKSKLIQQIIAHLDIDGVKQLGDIYRAVITAESVPDVASANWLNNERLYAAHLLIKLVNHSKMTDNEWRTDQLQFLMQLALFKTDNVGIELANMLKGAFFSALDLKHVKFDDLQTILMQLIESVDDLLKSQELRINSNQLINTDNEINEIWSKSLKIIRKTFKKRHSKLKAVFLILFQQMSLQLFNDFKLADESLNELFACYEKIRRQRKTSQNSTTDDEIADNANISRSEDPEWIEVVIDLFLSLLSHNSHLLRSVIRTVFPHLCDHLTANSIHQVLSILDPSNENPLSKFDGNAEDEEESNEEDKSEESDESESNDSNSDDSEEESDDFESKNNDKLRMALHKVLSEAYQSDGDESIDLDAIDDEKGEKLDSALAEAFKQFKPNRGNIGKKKQSKDEALLTHFRTRVLDLIDIYLDSNPSMHLTLEIMLPLLGAVEFTVRNAHQTALQQRLKATLKKLSGLRKFSDLETDEVNADVLADLLQSLLDKGTKNAAIVQDMGEQIADCCVFVIRCLMVGNKTEFSKSDRIIGILCKELEEFFRKRDSLTPYVLFKSLFQLPFSANVFLINKLFSYAIADDSIKAFRKSQALELIKTAYSNQRLLSSLQGTKMMKKLQKAEQEFLQNVVNYFQQLPEANLKERFVSNLFSVLTVMKRNDVKFDKWAEIGELIRDYRSSVSLSNDAKSAFNKLCKALSISNVVQMKANLKKANEVNEESNNDLANGKKEKKDKKDKKKRKSNDNLKLKKEAKALRLQSLSEGLEVVNFDQEMPQAEDSPSENDELTENKNVKQRKKEKRKNKSKGYQNGYVFEESGGNKEEETPPPAKKKKKSK